MNLENRQGFSCFFDVKKVSRSQKEDKFVKNPSEADIANIDAAIVTLA